jgi:hypothetical protein
MLFVDAFCTFFSVSRRTVSSEPIIYVNLGAKYKKQPQSPDHGDWDQQTSARFLYPSFRSKDLENC